MRVTTPLLAILLTLALGGVAGGDDWSVRRSPFDPRVVARYKALLNRRPNDGYALRKLVSLYRKHRSLKALVSEYRRLARAKPRSFAFQVILGHLQRRSGNNEEAVKHYERAARLNPRSPTVPAALAALYRKLGRSKDAERAYTKALSLASSKRGKKRYLRALATLALAGGDLAGAREHFNRLVALEPKNILVRIELAQAMAKSGHRTEAITEYRRILKMTTDSARKADVLKEIGALLEQEGKEDKAVATFRRAMSLTARGHWLRRELTERIISIYRKREDLKSLIEHYERAWTRKGHFEHEILGRLYDETGDETKALKSYRAALRNKRHAVDTRVRLIALLERTGQDREVIKEYRRLARIAPGEPRYQLELAKRLYRAGKQKEAFQILDRCGRRFPGDASVHSALADLYARWGEQKRAMRAAQVLVRIEPRDASHLINLGEQYYLQGNKRKALETWRRLLQVVRKRHAGLAKLAEVLDQHDMTREAIALYRRAIRLKPKHMPYHRSLALLLERKRKTVKALEAWDEVLKLAKIGKLNAARREARSHIIDILHRSYQLRSKTRTYRMDFEGTGNADAGFMLAEALLKLGRQERAAAVYRKILELDPDNLEAMTALEAVYRRQRKLARAVALLKRMAKLQPQLAKDYFQRIADLLRQLYRDKEALVYAHKAVALGTRDARSYQRLGELYEKMEDYGAAMTAYRKAIKLAPNRFVVHFALARLHTQQGQYELAEKLFRRVIRSAKAHEVIRKAFRLGVELADYLGQLKRMEKEILPLSVMSTNAETYRRLLVKIYRRRVPMLINQVRQGNAATRRTARKELRRIGIRGLAPLLEELATASTGRGELVRMLGYLGNANAVIPLLRIAQREPEETVLTIRGTGYHRYRYGRYRGSRMARLVNQRVEAIVAVGRIADKRAVDGLVRLRSNREGAIRDAATWALSRIRSRASSRALFAALGDPRVTVQIMACSGLGVTGGSAMRPVLEEVMMDRARDERVRAACAWGLGVIGAGGGGGGGASVPGLTMMLHSGDVLLQRCAAWALGVVGDKRPLSDLVRAMWSKRRDVRRVVLWAIAQISAGAAAARPPTSTPDVVVKDGKLQADLFVEELTGAVETLRGRKLARSLTRVVGAQREALTTGLREALKRHRDVVLRVLGDLDAEPSRPALGMLSAGRSLLDAAERTRLDRGVDRVCRSVRPDLLRLTDHRDALVRAKALSVYAKLAPKDAEAKIREALSDPDWDVRLVALRGIRTAHLRGGLSQRAVVRMVASALRARHFRVREMAARVAGQLGRPALTPLLLRAARDPNGFVRQAATLALGLTGGPSAAPGLHQALSDEVPHVRAAACLALGRLRVSGARAWVAPLVRDPSPRVRRAAQRALRTLR